MAAILAALSLSLAFPGTANAVQVYLDFGNASGGLAALNNLSAANSGATLDLSNLGGVDSTWDIAMPSVIDGVSGGWNPANALPAGWARVAADDFVTMTVRNSNFDIENLDPTLLYDVQIVMSRNLAGLTQDVTVNGVTFDNWDPQIDGYQNGNILVFNNVAPTGSGRIRVRIHRDGGTAVLNGVRVVAIPEPSRVALLLATALLLPFVRRKV